MIWCIIAFKASVGSAWREKSSFTWDSSPKNCLRVNKWWQNVTLLVNYPSKGSNYVMFLIIKDWTPCYIIGPHSLKTWTASFQKCILGHLRALWYSMVWSGGWRASEILQIRKIQYDCDILVGNKKQSCRHRLVGSGRLDLTSVLLISLLCTLIW